MAEEVKEVKEKKKKELPIAEVTICKSTQQMLRKAAEDGVETAFHRAADMKVGPGCARGARRSAGSPRAGWRSTARC